MAAAKKKKLLTYNGKPLIKCGDRIYYGNLEDKYILALDITEEQVIEAEKIPTKVKIQLMDNTGELGNGQVFRKAERENLYKALDIGSWWLQDALNMG
ncbi:MAG: hypothetical protein IJT23_10405 [Clostridia bacterium]|nr:hypothetical protein [Clostridia bacterium]